VIFFLSFNIDLSFDDIIYFDLDGAGNKKDRLLPVCHWTEGPTERSDSEKGKARGEKGSKMQQMQRGVER
jgi:hypothetical protein